MAKYINAEAIREHIKDYGKGAIADGHNALDPVDDIIAIAGLVDFMDGVEIVRCKECKYARGNLIAIGMVNCLMYRDVRKGEDFCNYGEKCENCGTPKIHGI